MQFQGRPFIPPSPEALAHEFDEFVFGLDWATRLHEAVSRIQNLDRRMHSENDPGIVADLIAHRGAVLLGSVGTTALLSAQQSRTAEVTKLEQLFLI